MTDDPNWWDETFSAPDEPETLEKQELRYLRKKQNESARLLHETRSELAALRASTRALTNASAALLAPAMLGAIALCVTMWSEAESNWAKLSVVLFSAIVIWWLRDAAKAFDDARPSRPDFD